jgi:hypothetical protein
VAQERREGWPVRLLKIIRNPLVILLSPLSAVSFSTGDARAGTVMAAMVVLSVALRFIPYGPETSNSRACLGPFRHCRLGDSRRLCLDWTPDSFRPGTGNLGVRN